MTETMTLGALMAERGVDRKTLAEAIGVSVPAVYRWADGTAWPSLDKLPALAAVLGMTTDDLLGVLIRTKGGAGGGKV